MALHFVVPKDYEAHLRDLHDQVVGETYPHWVGGRFNWAAQSYLNLRQHFEHVTISLTPQPGIMNFGHCMTWRGLGARRGEYRVSVRADFPRLFDVDFEILQNPAVELARNQTYLPYWPIPGILPRNSKRKEVRRVAYAGRFGSKNLAGPLIDELGQDAFKGLEFAAIAPDMWHDMSEIDLLIAIRSFDKQTHDNKPPSKLFNAWNAGIPLVAGFDSAFSEIAKPGDEYVRVGSLHELNEAIQTLRNDSSFYDRVVAAGIQRRHEISHEAIVKIWSDELSGPIKSDFDIWKENNGESKRNRVLRSLDIGRSTLSRAKSKLSKRR